MTHSKGYKEQLNQMAEKPCALIVNDAGIPQELKAIEQWVAWRYIKRNGKWSKIPYNPKTGAWASSTSPLSWCSYKEALAWYKQGHADGIGFVFTAEDPYVGIDFDNCRNPETGILDSSIQWLVDAFATYAEISPSQTGVKLILCGDLASLLKGNQGTKVGDFEAYQSGRYFTITGHALNEKGIHEAEEALKSFVVEKLRPDQTQLDLDATSEAISPSFTDEYIWSRIDASKNGKTIRALMNGDLSAYQGDDSAADLALCRYIAFWFGRDYHTIELIFNQSLLAQREKWTSRPDYRERTINKAIRSGTDTYRGHQSTEAVDEGFANFSPFETTDSQGRTKVQYKGIGSEMLVNRLTLITEGWPKRVQSTLFVREENDLLYLDDSNHLFAWMGRVVTPPRSDPQANPIRWKNGVGMVKEAQFLAALQQSVEPYDAVVKYPHEPHLPGHYYCHPSLEVASGNALDSLLKRFQPASEVDAALLLAFFLSIICGVPPGQRPAWLITSHDDDTQAGRGVGKSTLVRMASALVGGEISFSANESINDFKKRLLSPEGRDKRIVLIDNVKSLKFSSSDLEALITAPVISGYQLYHGEGRLVNTLLWCLTINGASLSKDLAQRCVVLMLKRPSFTGDWEGETLAYIERHRWEILADMVNRLRVPAQPLATHSRWGAWEDLVLARVANPVLCQQAIELRQGAIDDDEAERDLVREEVVRSITIANANPDEASVFISSQRMADFVFAATGEKMLVNRASSYVKTLGIRELKKQDQKLQRGWLWTGMNCRVERPCLTLR